MTVKEVIGILSAVDPDSEVLYPEQIDNIVED